MSQRLAVLVLVLALGSFARAQTISTTVTFQSSTFDIKAVDPAGTAYAFNLTRNFSEIWASTDNARTFTFRGRLPSGAGIFRTMTSLSDGTLLTDVLLNGTYSIWRSTDHGVSWRKVLNLGQFRLLTPHSIDEFGGTTYLIEYQDFTKDNVPIHLWTSPDRGATWSIKHTFEGHRHGHLVRVDPKGGVWVSFGDLDSQAGTFRSTDGGSTFTGVLVGEEGRIDDLLFVGTSTTALFGQDIPFQPPLPSIATLTAEGVLKKLAPLPGPSVSIHKVGAGYLVGETREPTGDVYPPNDVSAHLFGSADGTNWVELGSYPRIDGTDYARADVYWVLKSGEAVLNLRHVKTLPNGGRGYQLLKVTITPPVPETRTTFSDNFDACTSTSNLGPNWVINGVWYCKVGRARGETGNGLALARTNDLQDTDVSALVQLNSSDFSGIVGRAANGSYYATRLNEALQRIEVIRVQPGSVQVLGAVDAQVLDVTSYRLRMTITGTKPAQFEVFRDGLSILTTTDPNPVALAYGQAGLLSGSGLRTQYDDFAVTGTPPPPDTIVFSDNFDACTSTLDLGGNWSLNSGTWYCKVGRARGETNAGLTLVKKTIPDDQEVVSLVQLNGDADGSGVVARAANGHFYLARILKPGRIEVDRVDNGVFTVLGGSNAGAISVDVSYTIGLEVTGSSPVQMTVTLGGRPIFSATDSSAGRLAGGAVGLFSGGTGAFVRTQYDNFVVRAL